MTEEGDRAREGHSHSKKRSAETGDPRVRKKAKSGSKEKHEVDGKHHRSSAKNSHSGSGRKPLQESKITSSKKLKSDAGTSGSEAEAIKLDSYEDLEKRVDGNNNLEKIMRPQGTENEGCELDFLPVEAKNCKLSNNGNQSSHSHKDRHKITDDKDLKPQGSRSEKDWKKKDSNGSTDVNCNKIHAKVKQTDNSHTSPTALKEDDVGVQIYDPISGCTQACVPDENDLEVRKEKSKAEKKRDKECTVNTTKDKTQGQKKKRSSHSTEHNEPKKNKKPKREEKGKKDHKEKEAKKAEDEAGKWKWWEEGKHADGQKWKSLEHKGPLFPPEYEPLPSNVPFLYDGKPLQLSLVAEEVATFYAKMLDHEYTAKETFQSNFFTDWREVMTEDERKQIKKLSKCDFGKIHQYFLEKAEEKKNMTKEEKQVLKEEANKLTEEYGYCLLDGHKEKIGNFRLEPPGLFRGRGEHPKMGKLKKRVQPEDVIINCSQDVKVPEPPAGHRWKRVQHDNAVTWLASWVENIHGHIKYIMLNPSSKLKGEKDWQKYETARKLKLRVDAIRREYRLAWTAREMKQRQRGVALYFIDKLALRAGNEKDDDTADTVGCCSLRVEHITLHEHQDGQDYVVEFDFLGKDSIRYYNKVPVEKKVFKNLKLFMENKNPEDDLFDRISTVYLNKKLNEAMPGLTAKVFRTFNASTTLQEQLDKLTTDNMTVEEKLLAYNRANRAVAILCNHQRAAPKTFEKSMLALQEKIKKKKEEVEKAKMELKQAKKDHREQPSEKSKKLVEKKEKALKRLSEQLKKLKLQETDREENKVIALGTSKLNYLDPRITVAWCKKNGVPVEKIYNKTHRAKFAWAIDMADENFQF
ncbi:DNA topoisomerase I, mitochondrial isoform X2 [Tachysurus vachellii]|uniref:DNA topoisomerase I, mitochondrial isoform X2 n=1 Tax=Tachysurus vachellii TaxID=175792 RepID=UPI00296B0AB3|nr:DNA topoisomerase I, mitochondrial isoform X2 [Tachysurus vachellii]